MALVRPVNGLQKPVTVPPELVVWPDSAVTVPQNSTVQVASAVGGPPLTVERTEMLSPAATVMLVAV